jgi:flagellin-like hook-associated protein FlgL
LSVANGASTNGTVTSPTVSVVTTGAAGVTEVKQAIFSAMAPGDNVTIGGLTFTSNRTLTATQAAQAFASLSAGATTGPSTTYGAYSGTLVGFSSAAVTSPTMSWTYSTTGTVSLAATGSQVSNADYATQIITTQLTTVTTAQSTISAGSVGLEAQLKNVTALKNGLTNTVNAISNVDQTAMQAKLQQLNNQQSIDYYLVSQMNQAASAILSIFR